jgi:hypothetical protein
MSETRIQVEGEDSFNEREWLRREVLWSSLMLPYDQHFRSWIQGLEHDYYSSNVSRQAVFNGENYSQAQALGYFNEGKKIATLLSSAALFRTVIHEEPGKDGATISDTSLKMQARSVDIAVGKSQVKSIELQDEKSVFAESERMAMLAIGSESSFARNHRLLRAAKVMTGLAINEMTKWREMPVQNHGATLAELIIPNGGTPRSRGPRVEKLQPVFHEIVNSDRFQKL